MAVHREGSLMKRMPHKNSAKPLIVKIISTFFALMFVCGLKVYANETRGINVAVKDDSGQELLLYKGSYALIIGVSDYTNGWPDLRSIPEELDHIEETLQKQGFHVTRVMNPDSKALNTAFENFIDQFGFEPDNRLLFFFSGHGHTRKGGEKGYLVPVDAPDPQRDKIGFLRKAIPMAQILSWSRQMEAKHALFLFDSCFSGTVFKVKALPKRPPHITRSTSLPVRQYIAAGDAGDTVPASSVFTPAFIDALEYGWADLNGDNYISGTELGIYLQEKVPQYAAQTPQYGKIKDYKLSRGDYVFIIKSKSGSCTLQIESSPSNAKVLVNGRIEGTSPCELKGINPGRLTVEIKKEGYAIWKEQVLLRKDRSLELKAVLKKNVSGGTIEVQSDIEQSRWYLDGVLAGRTPDKMKNVPPGTHRITVKAKGHSEWSDLINVVEGESISVKARLDSGPSEIDRPAEKENKSAQARLDSGPSQIDRKGGRIYVNATPANAQVKIMNIRPKYRQGMFLSPGFYRLNVSAAGYITQNYWIKLTKDEERHISIQLSPLHKATVTSYAPSKEKSKVLEPGALPLKPSPESAESSSLPAAAKLESTSQVKPAPAKEVIENIKRAFVVWKDSLIAGPTGPTEESKGNLDIGDPSRRGAP